MNTSLRANKHVLLETLGATRSANLELLNMVAHDNEVKLAVDYTFVHHAILKTLKTLIDTTHIKKHLL